MIEIVRGHIRDGIRPIPIPYRQKGPVLDNWLSLVITEENVGQYFNGSPSNVGAILGAPSGNLQDVDLDCFEATYLARLWLPSTRTFGRATNPTSHYEYRSPDLAGEGTRGFDDPIAKSLSRKSKLLELRSNGGQTVLPGSTHKDTGELITWDNPEVPFTECSRATLERTVAGIAAGCMLMRYWQPSAADVFVSTLRAAEWSDEKIDAFLNPIAGSVNLDAPSIDPAAWREALALPRLAERAEEKERKAWEKARSDFFSKMVAWLGFPVAPTLPRVSTRATPASRRGDPFVRASAWAAAVPEAISGSGGHAATFAVARKLVQDFGAIGLNESDAWAILVEYNARCKPPWSEKELQHKLDSARNAYTSNPVEDRPPPDRRTPPSSGTYRAPASDPRGSEPTSQPLPSSASPSSDSNPVESALESYRPEPAAMVRVPEAALDGYAESIYAAPEAGAGCGDPPPPPAPPSGFKPNEANWRRHLLTKKVKDSVTGQPKEVVLSIQPNVCTILTFHPAWAGVLVYDEFTDCVIKTCEPPWPDFERSIRTEPHDPNARRIVANEWTELDDKQLVNWLAREENINVADKIVGAAVEVVGNAMKRHPVRDYLRSLVWDGVPRLDEMLGKYFGAGSTLYRDLYTRGVSSRWMISAVARVMRPGCQADCALILESKKQGRGKSTGLEILASSEWFADSGIDIGNKDSYQNLRGVWIYELGELDGVRGREVTKVKNYIGARADRYRRSFGHRSVNVPRQGVFAGTTNECEYLQDTTGNRRFWPVKILRDVDREGLRRDRDQLWAEAYHRFLAGEAWHIDTVEFRKLCEEQQRERVRDDVWAPKIAAWLENPTIMALGADGQLGSKTVDISRGVLTHEVLDGALSKPAGDATRGDEMRVATILRGWGYEPGPQHVENGKNVRRYIKGDNDDE